MSLISEALKEAQREHTVRKGLPPTVALVDNFFPYPSGRKRGRPNIALLIGGVAVVLLAAAGATYARFRASRASAPLGVPATIDSSPGNVAVATAPTTLPVQPATNAPRVIAASPRTPAASSPIVSARRPIDAREPTASASMPSVQRPPSSTGSVPAQVIPQASTPAARDTAVVRVVTAAPAPTLSNGNVHIVVDPAGARPADSLFQLAYAEHLRNNLAAAQDLYERAIALPQAPAGAFNNYGALLSKRGNQTGAREMFQQALTRDPENVDAWINLGDSYNVIGHHGEAMAAFARAMQLDPASSALKIRLAAEYRAIGDTSSARRMYDEASTAAPKDPAVHHSFAGFLQSQHDIRGAIREYQQFVDLAPGIYGQDTIDGVKQYIASLRRMMP